MAQLPFIGLSACMMHHDAKRPIFKGKRLLYMEESMGHYVNANGAYVAMIPSHHQVDYDAFELLQPFDGLLLTGGVDLAPATYDETPLSELWQGDAHRDKYEIKLTLKALELGIPVLGICRGAQVLNVALGGSLYQDISTQVPGSLVHRDWDIYDDNQHEITIVAGSKLSAAYGGISKAVVNSVHHQGIKKLGQGLVSEAFSSHDNIIEAIRMTNHPSYSHYGFAVQWHPEFHAARHNTHLDSVKIISEFISEAQKYSLRKANP
jgi:putative glutamine amidotransferase